MAPPPVQPNPRSISPTPIDPRTALRLDTGTVALVAAVRDELLPIIKRLGLESDQPWFVGQISGRQVVAAVTGVGHERAGEVFTALLDEHKPDHVIHLGFAGGLDPSLQVGTILNIQWVIDGRGAAVRLNGQIPQPAPDSPERPAGDSLLTMDHLVHSVSDKHDLLARHHAAAVDMETFHIATLAARRGLRMTMLRAISDPAGMSIPQDAVRWVRPDGTHNIPLALWYLATHPWKLPVTLRLARNARQAADNLARKVEEILRSQS